MSAAIYVVLNENTLGCLRSDDARSIDVLGYSVVRGGRDWKNGPVPFSPGIDTLRPATRKDFDDYRVVLPPDFEEVAAEKLAEHCIMSPIRPAESDVGCEP